MIAVLCPVCPPDGACHLCGGVGTVDQALLYDHEPKVRAHEAVRPCVVSRVPVDSEPAPPTTAVFVGDDWVRFRDLARAVPGCLIAVAAKYVGRCVR